jgi:hypothetical protein
MPIRRDMLFEANKKPSQSDSIPATVRFTIDKKKRMMKALTPEGKMLVGLRKALAKMSDKNTHGCRFYIDNNRVQMLKRPSSAGGRVGEKATYSASGRCKVGVCHPEGHKSSKVIEFSITFRDTEDSLGLPDVDFFDPTTIDELPRNTQIL